MDVHHPGEHQQTGRIDHVGRRRGRAGEIRLDRHDPTAVDLDIGDPRSGRGDDGPATNDQGHEVFSGTPTAGCISNVGDSLCAMPFGCISNAGDPFGAMPFGCISNAGDPFGAMPFGCIMSSLRLCEGRRS